MLNLVAFSCKKNTKKATEPLLIPKNSRLHHTKTPCKDLVESLQGLSQILARSCHNYCIALRS